MNIIFCNRKSKLAIGSWLIRVVDDVKFSHVAIELDGYIYESVWPKSRILPYKKWVKKYTPVEVFYIDQRKFDKDLLKLDLEEMIEVRYSFNQLFLIGLGILAEPFSAYLNNRSINGSHFLICTEFVGNILANHFGIEFGESKDMLSVRDIYKAVKGMRYGNFSDIGY
jgi:hypothetical protein